MVEFDRLMEQQAADLKAELAHATDAADRWHTLTDALVLDLRIIPGDEPDDAETWRRRIRDALWLAYGIGRRHEREGIHFVGQSPQAPTPFAAGDTIPRSMT